MKNGHRGSKFGPEVHLNGPHKVTAPFLNILFFCDSVGENIPKNGKTKKQNIWKKSSNFVGTIEMHLWSKLWTSMTIFH